MKLNRRQERILLSSLLLIACAVIVFLVWPRVQDQKSGELDQYYKGTNRYVEEFMERQKLPNANVDALRSELLIKGFLAGDTITSFKVYDPTIPGAYAMRVLIPYYKNSQLDSLSCGLYGTPLCGFIYIEPGKEPRIIAKPERGDDQVYQFTKDGILWVRGSFGDAGFGAEEQIMIDPKNGSSTLKEIPIESPSDF